MGYILMFELLFDRLNGFTPNTLVCKTNINPLEVQTRKSLGLDTGNLPAKYTQQENTIIQTSWGCFSDPKRVLLSYVDALQIQKRRDSNNADEQNFFLSFLSEAFSDIPYITGYSNVFHL